MGLSFDFRCGDGTKIPGFFSEKLKKKLLKLKPVYADEPAKPVRKHYRKIIAAL